MGQQVKPDDQPGPQGKRRLNPNTCVLCTTWLYNILKKTHVLLFSNYNFVAVGNTALLQ